MAQPDQGARNRCRAPPDHFRMALIMYQMICVGCYRAVQPSAPLLSYARSTAGPGFVWRTRAAARNGRCTASALATPTFGQVPRKSLRFNASTTAATQGLSLGMRCRLSPTADVPSHTSGAAMCQTRKSPYSFDHIVGAGEQRLRYGQAKRLGGFRLTTS